MARKSQNTILKRQREAKKAVKAAQKRDRRAQRKHGAAEATEPDVTDPEATDAEPHPQVDAENG